MLGQLRENDIFYEKLVEIIAFLMSICYNIICKNVSFCGKHKDLEELS